jgi:hypothetical protein
MKKIRDLDIPFNDAIEYNDAEKLSKFISHYNVTSAIDKLDQPNTYYVIGEKGTGKTAICLYYISRPGEDKCKILPLSETFFERFVFMFRNGRIRSESFATIWRCILLLSICNIIYEKATKTQRLFSPTFWRIRSAIRYYSRNSKNPEVEKVFTVIEKISTKSTFSIKKILGLELKDAKEQTTTFKQVESKFEAIELTLIKALEDFKTNSQVNLFLDGVDAKPGSITYQEYQLCLKELTNATRHLNGRVFKDIKNHKKKFRVITLIRPDVFIRLDVYNSNLIALDNSVLLSWDCSNTGYRQSDLFKTADKFFYSQNMNKRKLGWDAYFSYNQLSKRDIIFLDIMNRSFLRPRDIFTAIKYLVTKYQNQESDSDRFQMKDIIGNNEFIHFYSNYLLGEVRNYANFYMSNTDFEFYKSFISYIRNLPVFTYHDYLDAWERFCLVADAEPQIENRAIYRSKDMLLQFFYDVNIIGYREPKLNSREFNYHYSYRDRSIYDIYPIIKIENVTYSVFKGIRRALNIV